MSDRTSLTINYAECDSDEVEKVLGVPEMDETLDGEVCANYEGVDGGGYEELLELAKRGVPCYGHHDEGQEYKGAYVACVGKKYREAVGGVGDYTVCLDFDMETGKIAGLAEARKFVRHWKRAQAAVIRRCKAGKAVK